MDKPNIRYNVTGDQAIAVSQVHEVAKSTETPWWGEDLKGMYPRAEDYPRLPDEDFERKFGQLRQVMQIEDLDCFIIAGRAATVWISGYFDPFTNVGYVIFPREGEPILIENFGHHTPTAKAISYIRNFREGWRVKLETFAYDEAVVDSLNEFGIKSGRVGICGWDIWEWEPSNFVPAKVMDALKREFPNVEFPFFDDLIMRLARVHSEHEMVFVEKSADMLDKMFEELEARVKPGMLECEVWGIVKYVMYREGGDDPFSQLIVSHPQSAPVGARFEELAPKLIGLDPRDVAAINELMDFEMTGQPSVKTALDVACWDILARSLNAPLYRLLGGMVTPKPEVVGSVPARAGRRASDRNGDAPRERNRPVLG